MYDIRLLYAHTNNEQQRDRAMNKRSLMIEAHKIAKQIVAIVGAYMVAMKLALKQAWEKVGNKMDKYQEKAVAHLELQYGFALINAKSPRHLKNLSENERNSVIADLKKKESQIAEKVLSISAPSFKALESIERLISAKSILDKSVKEVCGK